MGLPSRFHSRIDIQSQVGPVFSLGSRIESVDEVFNICISVTVRILACVGGIVGIKSEFHFPIVRHSVMIAIPIGSSLVLGIAADLFRIGDESMFGTFCKFLRSTAARILRLPPSVSNFAATPPA